MSSFLENVSENHLTEETIRKMFQLVTSAVTDPKFQELVYSITNSLPGKDYSGEVRSIFNWVKSNVRYTRDPYGVELVQDPWSTIKRGRGDCDDMSIIIAAMGEVMGNPSRFVTVSTRPDKEPCHVYPELFTKGRWTALDVTVAGSAPGWRPSAGITDRKVWTRKDVGISGYDSATVEGLGMEPFFRSSMRPINLTPDVPNDVSHTYTDFERGEQVTIHRPQPGTPRAMVARYSDLTEQPGPGGIPYDGHYPIRDQKSYRDAWSFIARGEVPIHLNAWGYMKPWKTDWSKALPQPNVPEDKLMMNSWSGYAVGLAGLDGATPGDVSAIVSAVAQDTQNKVAKGQLHPSQAAAHAAGVVDALTKGDTATVSKNPITAKTVIAVAKKRGQKTPWYSEPSLSWLPRTDGDPLPGLGEYYSRGATLGDLGDAATNAIVDAVQKDVTKAVASGAIAPSDAPAAASKVVDAVQSGDTSVVNPTATPETHAVLKRIKGGGGTARTPATKPHHPISAGTRREAQMRASSTDYWENDPSLEWNPELYGLDGIRVGRGRSLYPIVHAHVKRMLPAAIRQAGVHPSHVARVLGRKTIGMAGLGQAVTATVDPATTAAAAGNIANAITGVVDPADAQAVAQAVQAGVATIVGQAAPQSSFMINLKGWGVPILALTAVGGLAYWMTRRKKLSYKRNPSRRRSGGRRGGKSDIGKYLLWGGGALAAYMIFKRPATPVPGAPQSLAQRLLSSAMNLFKPTASGAPSPLTSAISNIFGAGAKAVATPGASAPSAPAPSAPYDSSKIITSVDTSTTPPPPTSSIVTNIDTGSSPGSDEIITDISS